MENKSLATKIEVITSFVLSLFFIIFLWGVWSREVFALGINLTLYLAGVTLFFVYRLKKDKKYVASDLTWIIPLLLLSISFALYENPKACFKFPDISFNFRKTSILYSLQQRKDKKWNVEKSPDRHHTSFGSIIYHCSPSILCRPSFCVET